MRDHFEIINEWTKFINDFFIVFLYRPTRSKFLVKWPYNFCLLFLIANFMLPNFLFNSIFFLLSDKEFQNCTSILTIKKQKLQYY